jgi:hypothetical protein
MSAGSTFDRSTDAGRLMQMPWRQEDAGAEPTRIDSCYPTGSAGNGCPWPAALALWMYRQRAITRAGMAAGSPLLWSARRSLDNHWLVEV